MPFASLVATTGFPMSCSLRLDAIRRGRVGVLGYGREGRSVVRALRSRYADVDLTVLVESGRVDAPVPVRVGAFDQRLEDFDVLLRSPGIPVQLPALEAYRKAGGRVVNPGSIWLAERPDVPVVGVTGSKGKSTTASLLAHLLAEQGEKVLLAGNIGIPLLDHLDTDAQRVVLELSSYQLADLEGRLAMGLITRLFPEHLDWHGSLEHYVACKLRISQLLEGRPLLVNAGDPVLMAATADVPGRIAANRQPFVERREDGLFLGGQQLADGASLPLIGRHNLDNMALALQAGVELGLPLDGLVAGLASFRPLPHRLESVAVIEGVQWINDSIATSPHATLAALQAMQGRPVTLIVGGKDRPTDWSEVAGRCRELGLAALITLPDNGSEIAAAFARQREFGLPIHGAASLDKAVILAREITGPGGVVLLSPGAPSFPHFRDFEDRGEQFTRAVRALVE
jgi:UDP-N-acetylmuramoyl-L-alanine---L-glutamate ligase